LTPNEFIASLPEPRRTEVRRLHEVIRKAAPNLKPVARPQRIGYGPWHYRYPSGRQGDAFVVTVANLKQAISLYILAKRDASREQPTKSGTRWLPVIYADRLGNVTHGKSNIRIRKLSEVDLEVVAEMVSEAAAIHGKA
jgi:uncharacterized protein DUF1801